MRKIVFASVLLCSPALAQQPPTPAEVKVPTELAQATVDYLAGRPYKEVAGLLSHWLKLANQAQQEKKE